MIQLIRKNQNYNDNIKEYLDNKKIYLEIRMRKSTLSYNKKKK